MFKPVQPITVLHQEQSISVATLLKILKQWDTYQSYPLKPICLRRCLSLLTSITQLDLIWILVFLGFLEITTLWLSMTLAGTAYHQCWQVTPTILLKKKMSSSQIEGKQKVHVRGTSVGTFCITCNESLYTSVVQLMKLLQWMAQSWKFPMSPTQKWTYVSPSSPALVVTGSLFLRILLVTPRNS